MENAAEGPEAAGTGREQRLEDAFPGGVDGGQHAPVGYAPPYPVGREASPESGRRAGSAAGDFAHGELLEKSGLRPVSTLALRRSISADWVRSGLEGKKLSVSGSRVAVAAGVLTGEVVRTVTELCLRHRYVLLDLPYGGEELCRQLRREYGVSLLLGPSKDQLEGAEALVLFDRRLDLSMRNPVLLRLYDDTAPLPRLTLPPESEVVLI